MRAVPTDLCGLCDTVSETALAGVVVGCLEEEFHAPRTTAYMDKVHFDRYAGIETSSGFWGKGDPLAEALILG